MLFRSVSILLAIGFGQSAAQAAEVAVPPPLQGWESWVMQGQEYRRCPWFVTQNTNDPSAFRCAWPGRLQLKVDAHGGSFSQTWQTYTETWVALPGNLEHWPRDLRANGAAAVVVERAGRPQLLLPAGNHQISGRFSWSSRPESLSIAAETALIDLTVDDQRVAQPERPDGAIWLGKRRAAEQAAGLDIQVYRLLTDEIPATLTTRLRLQVAGDAREEVLARPLPNGMVPMSLAGSLPARIDANGRLRVQVRPGSHELLMRSRASGAARSLARPTLGANAGLWPKLEIWSFAGVDRLRVAAASGPESVDPAQADVPAEWREYPAFRMDADAIIKIEETQRGLAKADENRLSLRRQVWRDFNHEGFTILDDISGNLRQGWRLDMQAPYRLESARSREQNLLVTEGDNPQTRGVELREPQVALQALVRTDKLGLATGWSTRFENVSGMLFLPPGHRLLAAIGPDRADGSWWSGWGYWSIFIVMVLAIFAYRLLGLVPGLIALAALVLSYKEAAGYAWLWANLMMAIALYAAVPAGKLQEFIKSYRNASIIVLAIALLPFVWTQVRYALYPQLAPAANGVAPMTIDVMATPAEADMTAEGAVADELASAPMPATKAEGKRRSDSPSYGLNAAQVIQRYAPGTQLQTGPGIPAWNYASYA